MSGRQTDTTLVIKARDEVSGAVKAMEAALDRFLATQKQVAAGSTTVSSGLTSILGAAAALDKAFDKATASAGGAAAALERQGNAIAANKAQIGAYRQQTEAAAVAAERLKVAIVDATLNGADAGPLRAQLTAVVAEMTRLERESAKLARANDTLTGNYTRSASTLAEVERGARLVSAATAFAQQNSDEYTRSLERQTVAARQNARVLQDISRNQYQDSGKSAERSGEVFRAVGLTGIEKQIEAETAATAAAAKAERDRADAVALTNAALRARGRIEGNGGSPGRAADTAFAQQLREEEAAATEAAAAEKQLVESADRLKAALNPLGVIQARLNTELAEANKLYAAGKINATELAQAELLLKNNADRAAKALGQQSAGGGGAFLGLKPHELTNLSYQINDVFTQLASGTSITQTLGQQGGQILQIFPRAGSAIAAAFTNPAVLAFVATMGTAVFALREAGAEAERTRGFVSLLASTADGSKYGADQLNASAEALDRYGLSAGDAVKVVRQFVRDGVDPTRLTEFGEAAENLAEVTGIDVVEAAKQLGEAFTGGYEAVKRLDDSYSFLTATQREHIKTLFDEGKASEARNEAFRIFSGIQQDAADKSRGPWASAVRELSGAWDGFIKTLANTAPIRAVNALLVTAVNNVTKLLKLASNPKPFDTLREMSNLSVRIYAAEQIQARDPSQARALGIQRLRQEYAELKKQYDATAAAARQETADTVAANTERGKKADADLGRATAARKAAEDQTNVEAAINTAREEGLRYVEENFKFASESAKQAYIAQRVEEARTKAVKAQADQRKREADEAKRAAKERRAGYIDDIQNNGREGILSTARSFAGKNERSDRGDLQAFFRANGVTIDPAMTAWCAAFVNAVLTTNGVKGTGSLAARSFLNFGQDSTSNPQAGDVVVLRRGKNSAQGHVGFFEGFDQRGNVRVLGGNQSDGVNTKSFNRNDVLGFRRAPNAAQVAQEEQKTQDDLLKKQEKFNTTLDEVIERRTADTAQLREQLGLTGEALLNKQREAAVEDAVIQARQDAKEAGIADDNPELLARIERLKAVTGAYFDAQHAREAFENARQDVDAPVEQLTALRDQLLQQIAQYNESGQSNLANSLMPQLDAVNDQLKTATANALAFYEALAADPVRLAALGITKAELDAIILKLQIAQKNSEQWGYVLGLSARSIAEVFANALTEGVTDFIEKIADGENVLESFKDAFLNFAADFLREIAQMILKIAAFQAAMAILRAVGVGVGAGVAHGGAVVGGSLGHSRSVTPAVFAAAARYHTGGIAGLRPNEIPIIAERGEEILTRSDPRHRANGGLGGAGGDVAVKNVVVYNAAEALERGFSDKRGEKVFFAFLRANSGAVKQAIGG